MKPVKVAYVYEYKSDIGDAELSIGYENLFINNASFFTVSPVYACIRLLL
jgi:hypothetical protein